MLIGTDLLIRMLDGKIFSDEDLEDLCDAAESAILDGGGFGWLKPPPRAVLGRYFRGVVLVPERHLFVGRMDGRVAASVQLQEPPRNNEAQAHAAMLTTLFVAPWARGVAPGAAAYGASQRHGVTAVGVVSSARDQPGCTESYARMPFYA